MQTNSLKEVATAKRNDGWSYADIAKFLNKQGYLTAHHNPWNKAGVNNLIGGRIKDMIVDPPTETGVKMSQKSPFATLNRDLFVDILNSNIQATTKRALLRGMIESIV